MEDLAEEGLPEKEREKEGNTFLIPIHCLSTCKNKGWQEVGALLRIWKRQRREPAYLRSTGPAEPADSLKVGIQRPIENVYWHFPMQMRVRSSWTPGIVLLLLMAVGAYLRLKNLDFQSLWLDELHTMIETDPSHSLSRVLSYLKKGTDPHPPFYHLTVHFWLQILGYSEYNGRLLSALIGILTIPAIYMLGNELYNRRVGLIVAGFTTFNFYNIYYSQEARGYIFAFLFACLSFTCFVRAVRNPDWKAACWYALTTSLLLYVHYYGFILLFAQAITVVSFAFLGRSFKPLFICFAGAFVLIAILYAPWIGSTLSLMSRTTSFWIARPSSNFFIDYFKDYFGNDPMTIYLFTFLLIVFLAAGMFERARDASNELSGKAYIFSFVVLSTWIFISYLVPFVQSLVWVPLLFNRYTIVTLPAILVSAAIGLELLFHSFTKVYVVVLVSTLSLVHLFLYNDYYVKPKKTQWREMIGFVVKNNAQNHPIISDRQWYEQYYFKTFNTTPLFTKKSQIPKLPAVWVMTGHIGQPLNKDEEELLKRDFRVKKSFTGYDAWAKLYVRKRFQLSLSGAQAFSADHHVLFENGSLKSKPLQLPQGAHKLHIYGYGTQADDEFPKVKLEMNGTQISEFFLAKARDYIFPFQVKNRGKVEFSLVFVNDRSNETGDRNVFVKYAGIYPQRGNIQRLYKMNNLKPK